MTIGQRLRRAMEKAGLSQKDVAVRAGHTKTTVHTIVNDKTDPLHSTVERMVAVIGTTYGEMYDEPRIALSAEDVETGHRAATLLERLLAADAAQKELRAAAAQRRPEPKTQRPRGDVIRDGEAPRHPADELLEIANHQIPETFVRQKARRTYKVLTDAMIGEGIFEGDLVYVRTTVDEISADGLIVVCRLNGALKIKQLDLRGGQRRLLNRNDNYEDLTVTGGDTFAMIGVVLTAAK